MESVCNICWGELWTSESASGSGLARNLLWGGSTTSPPRRRGSGGSPPGKSCKFELSQNTFLKQNLGAGLFWPPLWLIHWGVNANTWKVRKRLPKRGINSFFGCHWPKTTTHCWQARLRFGTNNTNWTVDYRSWVLFSDESKFALRSLDGRGRVWRRYAQCNISPGDSDSMVALKNDTDEEG